MLPFYKSAFKKLKFIIVLSLAHTPGFSLAVGTVHDDLSLFANNSGSYELQIENSPEMCKYGFRNLDVLIDLNARIIGLKVASTGADVSYNKQIEVNTQKDYPINCLYCGNYKYRIVAKGHSIISQRKGFNLLDPEWPMWRDNEEFISFIDADTVAYSGWNNFRCIYSKNALANSIK